MVNDISIMAGIVAVFLFLGVLIPVIQADLGADVTTYNAEGIKQETLDEASSASKISLFTVGITILKLAAWDFGDTLELPVWLDAVFTLMAITLVLLIARNIWIGGGG